MTDFPPPPLSKPVPAWRRASAVFLTFAGLVVYVLQTAHRPIRRWHDIRGTARPLLLIGVIAVLLALPAVHRPVAALLDRLRHPSRTTRRLVTLLIWLFASLYLGFTAVHQGRDFRFKTQDEFMYLVQVQAVAHGHLWMPQHPLADFFQEFYVFVKPVTSGMYFPGAAMVFAPAVWLHVPFALWALFICGGVVAMTYRVTAELIDSVAGLLAALLMVGLTAFRSVSPLTLSYMPMTLMGLVLFWAYLHWRQTRRLGWAAVIGIVAGFSAITRPLDAIVFFLPVFALMVLDWAKADDRRPRDIVLTLLVLTVAAAPFLSLQLALDKAVSGHILKTPIQAYQDQFWPGTVGGLHPHLLPGVFKPATPLPQFQDNYEGFVKPHYRAKARSLTEPYVKELQYALPHYLLFVPLLLSVLGLTDRRRAAFWVILPLFPTAYIAWVMFIKWYAIVIAPVVMFGIVLGGQALADTLPRWRSFLAPWAALSIAALAIKSLPELAGPDKPTGSVVMSHYNALAPTIRKPAIVLFRYHREIPGMWKHEQTYNADAAWFDDEPIIRAHDLGPRNVELLNYYASRQPTRTVYLFDQGTVTLTELGNVAELAADPGVLTEKMSTAATTMPTTKPAAPKSRVRRPR